MTRAAEMLQRYRDNGGRATLHVVRMGDDVVAWSTNRRDVERRAPLGAVITKEKVV